MTTDRKRGYLYILLAAMLYSTTEVALKALGGAFAPMQVTVERVLLGAAALAGLAVGVWNGFDELAALRRSQCVFRPQREEEACLADLARWHRAVERSRSWIENNV